MRPNQNRRMRGRNRPKGPNPLTRSYESNGPDVKLRGTAQHIADKYAQLARDALASGDPVAAESYFQHGEHYFRIVTGAQDPQRPLAVQGYARNGFDDEEEFEESVPGNPQEQGRQGYGQNFGRNGSDEYGDPGQQPQPFERHDFDGRQNQNRGDRNERNDRGERQDYRRDRFQNRNDRPQRADGERGDYNRDNRGEGRPDYRNDQRAESGRQDYAPRQESRQEPRQDSRQDYRQDYRNDAQRGENPRESGRDGGNRYENGRGEPQPRQGDFPRRGDRRREEAARAPVDEAPGLPAFLMTATRNAPPAEAEEAPVPRATRRQPTEAEPQAETPAIAQGGEEDAPAPKPRRRRTRYKAAEGEAPKDNGESVDASSAAE